MTWTLKTSPVSSLPKYTRVFGVPVFAASSTTAAQFQHTASVLAAWLDNDGDGCVDNPTVLTKLTEIDLSCNRFSDEAVEQYFPSSLKVVNLAKNQLARVPAWMYQSKVLETVDLSGNQLRDWSE